MILDLIPKRKYGPSIKSGRIAAKDASRMVMAWLVSGRTELANPKLIIVEKIISIIIILSVLSLNLPDFLISVLRWGFQWGTISRMKWLQKARGIAIRGFGILVAIAAPTAICGDSNIGQVNIT